jgi:hypothetical protein
LFFEKNPKTKGKKKEKKKTEFFIKLQSEKNMFLPTDQKSTNATIWPNFLFRDRNKCRTKAIGTKGKGVKKNNNNNNGKTLQSN